MGPGLKKRRAAFTKRTPFFRQPLCQYGAAHPAGARVLPASPARCRLVFSHNGKEGRPRRPSQRSLASQPSPRKIRSSRSSSLAPEARFGSGSGSKILYSSIAIPPIFTLVSSPPLETGRAAGRLCTRLREKAIYVSVYAGQAGICADFCLSGQKNQRRPSARSFPFTFLSPSYIIIWLKFI